MKNTYTSPKLVSFGNISEVTQAVGNPSAADTVFLVPGSPLGNLQGSQDVILVPCSDPINANNPLC